MNIDDAVKDIKKQLLTFENSGKKLCITCSFQTHSLPLLHICTQVIPQLPVLFIDTGYHFPETYAFKNQIAKDWQLNIVNLRAKSSKLQQRDKNGEPLYVTRPDYCCFINKVEPLDEEIINYDIWIAGLRRGQTAHRSHLEPFELLDNGVTKYHPILEWTGKMIYEYRKQYDLPAHPLEQKGYFSIGCMPCTSKITDTSDNRGGRWLGSNKTECGIHLKK